MTEGKTLKELNVKPGDVVEATAWGYGKPFEDHDTKHYAGKLWMIYEKHPKGYCGMCAIYDDGYARYNENMLFRIISRASDTPKLWRDMTDEEKGALLLAHHEGKVIESHHGDMWRHSITPAWFGDSAYRVKPEPNTQVVHLMNFHELAKGHAIVFSVIDGTPDCTSIRMEAL